MAVYEVIMELLRGHYGTPWRHKVLKSLSSSSGVLMKGNCYEVTMELYKVSMELLWDHY